MSSPAELQSVISSPHLLRASRQERTQYLSRFDAKNSESDLYASEIHP
jgi:hypothetical protein